MKKAKKLLSVFLAALMVMTTLGGVMMASAATEADAQAAVDAYVKGEVTYPTQNGKKTAEASEKTLNALLGAILQKMAPEKIYTDATINTLINAIYSVVKYPAVDVANNLKEEQYAAAKAYLNSIGGGDSVWKDGKVDLNKLTWDVTAGDRAGFEAALLAALRPLGSTCLILLPDLTSMWMGEGFYGPVLLPLLESLHVDAPSSSEYSEKAIAYLYGSGDLDDILRPVIGGILDLIDAIVANPLDTLCTVLPDFAYNYPANVGPLQEMLASLGVKDMDLTDLTALLNSLLASTGITLPEIDLAYLASLGTAAVAESNTVGGYRMAINGDKADVFMAIMQYVGEVVQIEGNQNAIIKLVGDQFGAGYGEEIVSIVDAARHGTSLDIADASVSLFESIAENLGIKADQEQDGVAGFFAKVMDFFNRIARAIVDLFKTFGGKAAA